MISRTVYPINLFAKEPMYTDCGLPQFEQTLVYHSNICLKRGRGYVNLIALQHLYMLSFAKEND